MLNVLPTLEFEPEIDSMRLAILHRFGNSSKRYMRTDFRRTWGFRWDARERAGTHPSGVTRAINHPPKSLLKSKMYATMAIASLNYLQRNKTVNRLLDRIIDAFNLYSVKKK